MKSALVRIGVAMTGGLAAVTVIVAFFDGEAIPAAWLITSWTLPSLVLYEGVRRVSDGDVATALYFLLLAPLTVVLIYGIFFAPEGSSMACFCLVIYGVAALIGYAALRGWNRTLR